MTRLSHEWLEKNYAGDLAAVLAAHDKARAEKPRPRLDGVPFLAYWHKVDQSWSLLIANWRPASDNLRAKGVKVWNRAKKCDREVIASWVARVVPQATGKRRVGLVVEKRRGPLVDPANLNKSFHDALVHAGLLIDDRAEWCEAETPVVRVNRELEWAVASTVTLEDLT